MGIRGQNTSGFRCRSIWMRIATMPISDSDGKGHNYSTASPKKRLEVPQHITEETEAEPKHCGSLPRLAACDVLDKHP